jgi:hypothetical protein
MPLSAWASARQFTKTVVPAMTSPVAAGIDAVEVTPARAVAGSPAMSATNAYTCPGILMVNPVLQGMSLDKGEWSTLVSRREPSDLQTPARAPAATNFASAHSVGDFPHARVL